MSYFSFHHFYLFYKFNSLAVWVFVKMSFRKHKNCREKTVQKCITIRYKVRFKWEIDMHNSFIACDHYSPRLLARKNRVMSISIQLELSIKCIYPYNREWLAGSLISLQIQNQIIACVVSAFPVSCQKWFHSINNCCWLCFIIWWRLSCKIDLNLNWNSHV